jgi:predicted double-glycine peptidase
MLGYFIPLAVIVIYGVAMRWHSLAIVPPVSWIVGGRTRFAIVGLLTTMVLTTPLSRLRSPILRVLVLVLVLITLATLKLSVWPFLLPAFNRERLAHLQTRMDANEICRQNTDYTCGPAAAVTALRKFGFKAEEGEIAILAYTTYAIGTPPDILADALGKKYGNQGLQCEYRVFRRVDDLRHAGITLAVMKYRPLVDHYVAVLEVTDTQVMVGDPLLGLRKLTRQLFVETWRFEGIVLNRALVEKGTVDP